MPIPQPVSVPRAGLCAGQSRVPLEQVDIRAEIRGAQARVTCVQQYRNREQQPIEAVYVFPLDEGAAVCGFVTVVGDVRYEAEVKPRESAFAAYDDAIVEGHGAFLLDEERPDVFTASIGNLPPGGEARIELTYVTELMLEGDAVRFMLPTTVSPRYAPAQDRVGVGRSPADALNPPSAPHVPYGLTFAAIVHAAGGLRRIESPSHPVAVDLDGQRATVTLSQEHSALDRDLVLLITPSQAVGSQIALERSPNGRIAASVTFRPSFATSRVPADVVFLVDRSGSMQGSSIEQVRNALQLCLRSLEAGCAFDIVGFGSSFESLFGECRAYDERSLADAHRHVSSLEASLGGTELLPALESVLGAAARRERVLQLVVLTDGQVTNTDEVLEAIRRCRDRVRVFTFGIGRGASHHLVKGLARAGNGAAEFIYPGERIEAKVMRQFARALAPAMADLQLDWGALRVTPVPSRLGSVFADEPARSYAWLDEVSDGVVMLRGRGPDGPMSWSLDVRRDDVVDGSTIGTLAARARIREIEEGGERSAHGGSRQRDRKKDHAVAEIVQLAMEYGLASRETSLVAIEKREVPVTQGVVLRRVPIAITTGWGGNDHRDVHGFGGIVAGSTLTLSLGQTGAFLSSTLDDAAPLEIPRRVERAMPLASRRTAGWLDRLRRPRAARSTSGSEDPSLRALDRLVALQRADGSWDLDMALADVIGVPLSELESRLIGATGAHADIRRAWATALALTYLTKRASESRQEWKLLAQKATHWLEGTSTVPPGGASWLDYAGRESVERRRGQLRGVAEGCPQLLDAEVLTTRVTAMRIGARRTLTRDPSFLARMPTGEVLALSHKPMDDTWLPRSVDLWPWFLDAYAPNLEPAWSQEVPMGAPVGLVVQGALAWVVDHLGVSAYDAPGTHVRRVPFPMPEGMRVGGLALCDGDFIVALQHDVNAQTPVRPGTLMRVSDSGEPRWTTTLPVDVEALCEPVFSTRDSWVCSYLTHLIPLTISADAVLVAFSNMPRTGIGVGYVVALDTGTLRYCTRRGPISEAAGLADGHFLVGYQGYGEFETLRYGASGEVLGTWPTHGYYVVHEGAIRVIELRNTSEAMHLVRLGRGGRVAEGERLDGYYTSRPCVRSDGTIFFARYGELVAARDLSIDERLTMITGDVKDSWAEVVEGDHCLYVAVTKRQQESLEESHLLRVDL